MIHTLLAYCFSWQIENDPEHEELTVYENNFYFKGVERFRHHSKHHNLQKLQNYCNVKVKHLRRANEVKYREGYRKWFMLVYTLLKTLQLLTKTLLRNKKNPFTTFANKAEKNWWWCAVAVTLLEFTLISTANLLTTLVLVPINIQLFWNSRIYGLFSVNILYHPNKKLLGMPLKHICTDNFWQSVHPRTC